MVPGGTSTEATQLNIESLWSGGPFADPVSMRHRWRSPPSKPPFSSLIMAETRNPENKLPLLLQCKIFDEIYLAVRLAILTVNLSIFLRSPMIRMTSI